VTHVHEDLPPGALPGKTPLRLRDLVTSRFRDGLIAEDWLIADLAEGLLLARKRRPEPTSTILAGPGRGVTSAARLDHRHAVRRGPGAPNGLWETPSPLTQ